MNPWGLAFGSTGILWSANNGTGTSTLYAQDGAKQSLTVSIPSATAGKPGVPDRHDLQLDDRFRDSGSTGAAAFIFAGEDGTIAAWNAAAGTNAALVADRSALGAVYKGIAMAANGGANFLYLTNFKGNGVDVFDANYNFVRSFTDATIPAGFAPFGIQTINGNLYVTYAKQLAPTTKTIKPARAMASSTSSVPRARSFADSRRTVRSTRHGASPWHRPDSARFAGDILIGNFGDGMIGAYDPTTGAFIDLLRGTGGTQITIPGLWALVFAPGGSTTLFFSSGPSSETHGLVGTLTPQ